MASCRQTLSLYGPMWVDLIIIWPLEGRPCHYMAPCGQTLPCSLTKYVHFSTTLIMCTFLKLYMHDMCYFLIVKQFKFVHKTKSIYVSSKGSAIYSPLAPAVSISIVHWPWYRQWSQHSAYIKYNGRHPISSMSCA